MKGRPADFPADVSYATAAARKEALEAEMDAASKQLSGMSGGGPMGLTPDAVKSSPSWRRAKQRYESAHAAVRSFNGWFLKAFAKEYREDRDRRRQARFNRPA